MRKSLIGIILLSIVLVSVAVPICFSAQTHNNVITYGETTYNNQGYKANVDNFFKSQSGLDLNAIQYKIITAGEVNKVSSTITHKTYNSNEIYSCALVNLNEGGAIKVTVDRAKITTITPSMYISALKTAGITQGHVYVTSPVKASGESALAGIMNSYEQATNVTIPQNVKQAANSEIVTESQIVESENITSEQLSALVSEVKQVVIAQNITNHTTIVNLIQNYTVNHNLNLSNASIEKLATSIEEVQAVQGEVKSYSSQVNNAIDNSTGGKSNNFFGLFK